MQYLITVIIVGLGLYYRKSKKLFCIQIIWIWVIMGLNNANNDYSTYQSMYNQSRELLIDCNGKEILYYLISYFFKKVGFSYQVFLAFEVAVCLMLIAISIKRMTCNICMVISLYTIFPMLENLIQVRNFIVFAIFTYAFSFYVRSGKKNLFIYILLIIVATGFHISALAFLLLPLVKIIRYTSVRNCKILLSIFWALFGALIVTNSSIMYFLINLLSGNLKEKLSIYYSLRLPTVKALGMILWQTSGILMNIWFSGIKLNYSGLSYTSLKYRMNNITSKSMIEIQIFNILTLPLYFYTIVFFRLYCNTFLFMYIYYANDAYKNSNLKLRHLVVILYYFLSFLFFDIFAGAGTVNQVFFTVYNNNFLW